jgi:sec-independent protein translocase protein TatB
LFDLSFVKIAVLAVIAIVVFGPDQLPKMAVQAGRALRDIRRMAENARADLTEHLGPEFRDFDINELNPKYFVRKHLLDEVEGATNGNGGVVSGGMNGASGDGIAGIGSGLGSDSVVTMLEPGESPPYDAEAT